MSEDAVWSSVIQQEIEGVISDDAQRVEFTECLREVWPRLWDIMMTLYGNEADLPWHVGQMIAAAARAFVERPEDLRQRDRARSARWYQSADMLGGMCYVDRYAHTLAGLYDRIPYFEELGLTYLHLMPLFRCPAGHNDGGYAVSSFRDVRPDLGTMEELAQLARALHAAGINLTLDIVLNHTADDHDWALRAKQGDAVYQAYYRLFPDRSMPDAYERTLREVFPDQAPGNFTFAPEMQRWVWTTFHQFQWDLNYANPAVFTAMFGEMLFLANQGADVLRFDAAPFIWKEMGTSCENLPQAHLLIEAWRLLFRVAAPAVVFKSEAIVHPDEVAKYIGNECQLSYNPLLMVCLWVALATEDTRLLTHSMRKRFATPENAAWLNYARSHDDIGWGFANEDCVEIGMDGPRLRDELNAFFTGKTPGSFARGLPFNYNPRTNDMRISGTLASLAGLEAALEDGEAAAVDLAIGRILVVMGVTIAASGIPLLYLGDEIGTLNDYSFVNIPAHAEDSRWAHRPAFDAARWEQRYEVGSAPERLFHAIQRMVSARKTLPTLAETYGTTWLALDNPRLVAFRRGQVERQLLVIANFSASGQTLRLDGETGLSPVMRDVLTGARYDVMSQPLSLPAYGQLWLCAD